MSTAIPSPIRRDRLVITEEPSAVSDLGRRGSGDADIDFGIGINGGLDEGIAGDGAGAVPTIILH